MNTSAPTSSSRFVIRGCIGTNDGAAGWGSSRIGCLAEEDDDDRMVATTSLGNLMPFLGSSTLLFLCLFGFNEGDGDDEDADDNTNGFLTRGPSDGEAVDLSFFLSAALAINRNSFADVGTAARRLTSRAAAADNDEDEESSDNLTLISLVVIDDIATVEAAARAAESAAAAVADDMRGGR